MSDALAVAILAEHITMGSSLAEIVARLGADDRSALTTSVLSVERAVIELRDLVQPRRPDTSSQRPTHGQSEAAEHTSIRNRYKGRCGCGRHVPEGRGRAVKIDKKWLTFCFPCAIEKGYAEAPKPKEESCVSP